MIGGRRTAATMSAIALGIAAFTATAIYVTTYTPTTAQYAPTTGGNPLAGVTQDPGSGIYVPATVSEWAIVLSVAGISSGNPSAIWLMQDASGNATEVTGTFPLTASGTGITYQQAFGTWTRKGIAITDGATGSFLTTNTSLPDVSATSQLVIAYVLLPSSAPAANRQVIDLGTTTVSQLQVSTTPIMVAKDGANGANGTAPGGAIRPCWYVHNHTATTANGGTDVDKLAPTYSASVTGKEIRLWNGGAGSVGATISYAVMFAGTAAELTPAQIKTLLQTLGFTITWSFLFRPRPANDNAWMDAAPIAA